MRRQLFLAVTLLCAPALAGSKSAAIEKLKQIERDIRSRAAEADEEVQRMRHEAKRITKEADEESARIKAEADAYTKKIQEEIREIRAKAGIASPPKDAPTREALTELLGSLVDPLLGCWEPVRGPASERESCLMAVVREKLRPYFAR